MAEGDNEVYQDQPDSEVPNKQPIGVARWLSPEYAKKGLAIGIILATAYDAYALTSIFSKYGQPQPEELPLFAAILGLQTAQIIGVTFLVSSFRPFSERIVANLTGYRLLIDNSINSIRGRFHRG